MDITKRQNLLVLWKESFSVVNRAAIKLIATGVLGVGLLVGQFVALVSLVQTLTKSGAGGVFVWLAGGIISTLITVFISFYMIVCFWRILSNTAENSLTSLWETWMSSFKPTLYAIVGQILWVLFLIPVNIAMIYIDKPLLKGIVQLAFALGVSVRLVYALPAIAIKGQGSVGGFVYSWHLTGKNYVDTLLMCLMSVLYYLVMVLFMAVCAYTLYIVIPLYFANSFDITHLTLPWWIVFGFIAAGVVFIFAAMFAFPIVVFVNRDYSDGVYGEDVVLRQNAELRPLTPEVQISSKPVEPEPLRFDRAPSADIGPESVKLSRVGKDAAQAKVQKPAPKKQPDPEEFQEVEEGLEVLQASFHTEQKAHQVQEQLKEVYQPKHDEEFIEYAEEDRMPTIVFDEQMTRQLEENRKFWQNDTTKDPATPDNHPEDSGPIRMSK